ncbi:MAG: leucyl aminopeptidase [Hyphomicrobiales bacterium]|nr:MAG: leucyl aminopeptidase [Hyphomicrobiales bacterium]
MATSPSISFVKQGAPKKGVAVVFVDEKLALGPVAKALDEEAGGVIARAAKAAAFKGKARSTLDIVAPGGLGLDRLMVVGLGKLDDLGEQDWWNLGGAIMGKLSAASVSEVTIVLERPDGAEIDADDAANVGLGMMLRAYKFDTYKSKKKDEDENGDVKKIAIAVADAAKAKKAWARAEAVGEGSLLARKLVDEPANVLGPDEFVAEAKALEKLGVSVEILDGKKMRKLGMNALLAVAQGSARPPYLVIMSWNGGKSGDKPVAFVGKGVVFDTGGISIKPAAGMEDMKGDMGGAAAVTGLMKALAGRKAKVNAIGIIGLVENMPDGLAQRPGDIIAAANGVTIEVLNTDAEGRLVLADALWYAEETYSPKMIVDLATLTGACVVALGHEYAALYANDDDLAGALFAAGTASGEKVWRMPLAKEYDKLIESKNADIKNTGGRWAGSITAAQFLQRFVKDTPWAHLDIAGTAMGSPKTDISQGWSSGFGVRLLDRMVADTYEK